MEEGVAVEEVDFQEVSMVLIQEEDESLKDTVEMTKCELLG